MSCECDCAGCADFCDCQRCSKPQTDLLAAPSNRPGLDAIKARIGDYTGFFTDANRQLSLGESPHLQALGTRDPSDPTMALVDAWSVVADVLTFYRERLTQEAYMRTASDGRSVRELANMIGFKPRPGIAATAHLAYLLDPSAKPVDIDPGSKAQTVPLPGETMQTFETDETLKAHAEWSQMKPRMSRPPKLDIRSALSRPTLRLADPALAVRPGERILFVFGLKLGQQVVREVLSAKTNIEQGFVELTLKPKDRLLHALAESEDLLQPIFDVLGKVDLTARAGAPSRRPRSAERRRIAENQITLPAVLASYFLGTSAIEVLAWLTLPPPKGFEDEKSRGVFESIANYDLPPRERLEQTSVHTVMRSLRESARGNRPSKASAFQQAKNGLEENGAVRVELAQAIFPAIHDSLYAALRARPAAPVTPRVAPSVYLLRTVSSPFGAVAPMEIKANADGIFSSAEWMLVPADMENGAAFLETTADLIAADSFAIISTPQESFHDKEEKMYTPDRLLRFARVRSAQTVQRGSYSLSGKVTKLRLEDTSTGDPLRVIPK